MQRASALSPAYVSPTPGSSRHVTVGLVNLLGVRVSVHAVLNEAEHERRMSLGITAFTDPALLDCLLELPIRCPVLNPRIWVETAEQPPGVVSRGDDGHTVTRLLEPVLTLDDVVIRGTRGREMRAVQDASLFASFIPRWVAVETAAPAAMVMEAKLFGVGLLDRAGQVILAAEQPTSKVVDGWAWLLWEKTYRRWLKERSRARETGSQAQATAEANATLTG